MTKLSVNINKIATIRNSRGGSRPSVLEAATSCEKFGAHGITVHPRPDERHIRYSDVRDLKAIVTREFNIEGNPIPKFMDLVLKVKPTQVTLVPDSHEQLTSNHGWDTKENKSFLTEVINEFRLQGIRTSVFVDADEEMVFSAAACGADRVELYTGPYAEEFLQNPEEAIKPFLRAAKVAKEAGLGLNAGHDLNLDNLKYFHQTIPWLDEVSIGHAIISDAIYLGLKETIKEYLSCLE